MPQREEQAKKRKRFDISKFWLNKKQPESTRKKRSRTMKQLHKLGRLQPWNKNESLSKQHKEKLQASNTLTWKSPELKKLMSRIKRAYWTGARKKRQSRRIKKFWRENPEKLKSMRQKIIQKYRATDWEKEIGKAVREYYKLNPKARILMRKRQKELYKNHPTMRKERQAIADLYYATHDEERRHFMHYRKGKARYRTSFGYVKSSYEKGVADFLSIPYVFRLTGAEYEPFTLYLTHTKPIPDFYLRKLRVIIEVYGGLPEAWKRKVKKNRDYRSLKIPVIAITPGEMWNLDYSLLKQAIKLSKTQEAKNFKPEKFMKPKPEWLENLKAEIKKIKEKQKK